MERIDLSMGKTLCGAIWKARSESWWWEVWNEPNIGYWQGTVEEYCKMYDYAADGLRKRCRLQNWWLRYNEEGCKVLFSTAFINHCLDRDKLCNR